MISGRIRNVVLPFVLLLLFGSPAGADPFVVNDGSVTIVGRFSAHYTLLGDDFSLSGFGDQTIGFKCFPCAPPSTTSLGGNVGGDVVGGDPGMFGGVSYPQIFLNGQLALASPSFNVAALETSLTVTQPFTLSARLFGYHTGNEAFSGFPSFFDATFTGSGTVTAHFTRSPIPGSVFDFADATYTFESASPSPAPEPASLLLLATGVAALASRRAFGRRAKATIAPRSSAPETSA